MVKNSFVLIGFCICVLLLFSCAGTIKGTTATENNLVALLNQQAKKTVEETRVENTMPVLIEAGKQQWTNEKISNWRSGFWPGIQWYLFEATNDEYWKTQARLSTEKLSGLLDKPVYNHDLGFQLYCSYGNAFRLTGNAAYKKILLRAADSLITLYNPVVGTILSWPYRRKNDGWPHHTIIDNMMNLELLFWAAKNGGNKKYYDYAVRHATVTMQNHFRPDYSTYHVLNYDDKTGKAIKGTTHQGLADSSMWARGQAWAIYGFTMAFRETGNREFLQTAINATNVYLARVPEDLVPYWDFDDPTIPNAPRDASAAAIVASALFELAPLSKNEVLEKKYYAVANAMLAALSSKQYLSGDVNHAFLLHSTGNKPAGKDVDVSIIYADYYFLEALLRQKKSKETLK